MHRFLIVIESAGNNFSAYSPDLPGCVAAGETHEETIQLMHEAVAFHLEGMRAHGETIPTPGRWVPLRASRKRGTKPTGTSTGCKACPAGTTQFPMVGTA
jgi:predicted RNase H-like HicB family nuclease